MHGNAEANLFVACDRWSDGQEQFSVLRLYLCAGVGMVLDTTKLRGFGIERELCNTV